MVGYVETNTEVLCTNGRGDVGRINTWLGYGGVVAHGISSHAQTDPELLDYCIQLLFAWLCLDGSSNQQSVQSDL